MANKLQQYGLLPPEFDELDDIPSPKGGPVVKPEDIFNAHCTQFALPPVIRELKFAKPLMGRNWMFDFAWPDYKLAVEIEGMGVELRCKKCFGKELIIRGRHGSIGGINADMEKYNSAIILGWSVLRFATKDVKGKEPIKTTMRVLAARGWRRNVDAV